MSWSATAVGKPKAVSTAIATQCARHTCSEPEETIKTKVAEIVAVALAAYPESSAVRVSASGSQSMAVYGDPSKGAQNQLKIEIEPLYNFVES